MPEPQRDQIEQAIASYHDPYVESDLRSAKAIKSLDIEGGRVKVGVTLGFPAAGHRTALAAALDERIRTVDGVVDVDVDIDWKVASHAVQQGLDALKNVRNIVAVASGKGGGRQIDRRLQSRPRALGRRREGGSARRRHLRA